MCSRSTPFSLILAGCFFLPFKTQIQGIQITYRTDGGIFKSQRLKAERKVTKSFVRDILYADDCAIFAHSEDDLQRLAESLSGLRPLSALYSQ